MRIGTLFSGIGSPEQGAKRVYGDKLELVFACEWDKYARESFKANYEIEDKHFHIDINDMDGTQYKDKVDIIVGGSPCQDFSLAGLRAGVDGNKGILIYQYIRIIQEVNPPIFVYENVKGMLSDKGGKTIKEFVEAFREIGYFCHYEVLNTKDYGVPQNRERIFLVGFKDKEHYYRFAFADKIPLEKRLKDILEDDVDEKYYYKGKNKRVNEYIKDKKFKENTWIDVYSKLHREDFAGCLTTRTEASRLTYVYKNGQVRLPTETECLKLQDFYKFNIVIKHKEIYKQAGNSISVNMMEMIFNQIEKSKTINPNGGLF